MKNNIAYRHKVLRRNAIKSLGIHPDYWAGISKAFVAQSKSATN